MYGGKRRRTSFTLYDMSKKTVRYASKIAYSVDAWSSVKCESEAYRQHYSSCRGVNQCVAMSRWVEEAPNFRRNSELAFRSHTAPFSREAEVWLLLAFLFEALIVLGLAGGRCLGVL